MTPFFNQGENRNLTPLSPLLIVDDDEGICRLLTSALRKARFQVECSISGMEAIQWLRHHKTALVLLDINLPDMKGQEVIETLKAEGIHVPYIVISGVDDLRVAVELMQSGALDYLLKDTQLLQLVVPVVVRSYERINEKHRLREAEGRFLQLAENIDCVFWISSPRFEHFTYISPAFEKIWGRPVGVAYEKPEAWKDAVLPADLPFLNVALERLVTEAESMEIEYRVVRPDGEVRWVCHTASSLVNGGGEVERVTGFVHDITERKDISRRLLAVAEQERRRVGADLHDDLCQRLAAIKLGCGLLARNLRSEESRFASMAAELDSSLGEATARSRSLAQGLAPVVLESEGLEAALAQLAQQSGKIFGIVVVFSCPEALDPMDPDNATHIYRIAQELIANAAKHAEPTRVELNLRKKPACLILEVVNNGKPFQKDRPSGMGLHFLRSRADALGGTLEFHPGPKVGVGSRILCTVPY